HAELRKKSHTGESLLAKFNKLAVDTDEQSGNSADICGFQGKHIVVRNQHQEELICEVRSSLTKKMSGVRNPFCVGDHIRYDLTPEGDAYITALLPRDNQLARADSHNKALLHVFAANVDHLLVVSSLLMPDIRLALIDRYLLIAHYNSIEPIIIINKCDLGNAQAFAEIYRKIGYHVFCTSATDENQPEINALRQRITGKQCVVAGQSGVGKSSLLNAMYPGLNIRVGSVSDAQQKGRHTTTSATSYMVGDGTTIIDTPGIRECGVRDINALNVSLLYPDIAAYHHQCKFNNCSHIHEPGCAVKEAVEREDIHYLRYDSYLNILNEDIGSL
ncbi:MAG: ribosome small subunit-dependent GTPase A, partial [Planctomycetes bacterium]|nr:ribosome small subunit-dependent GTPase A [Planctomycetota bacterium]